MEIDKNYSYNIINELIILLVTNIEVMEEYIFVSINVIDINILKEVQKEILEQYKNIGITFKIENNKTIIYIYKN